MQPNQGASASNNPSAQTWNYDNSGNWNSTTKTIGNTTTTEARNHSTSDQITSIAGNTATHDAKGNLTDYEINSKTYEVEYDLDNRITKVDVNNTDVEYRYDALGRRVIRKQGSTTSALIWWGNSENAEHKHTATQTVIQNDIMSHPTRLNAVIARAVDGSKFKLEWYHKNYLDHVYAVSDDSGDLIEHYRYTAFGEVTIYDENGNLETSSQIENTIMWNTRRLDTVSGYYLYKYRHYDPQLGRWPSRDPIEERGGINLYAFVNNQPINGWDQLGLTIKKFVIEYTSLANIRRESGKATTVAITTYSSKLKKEGETTYERKVDNEKCCVRVKAAPSLIINRVRVVLPYWNDVVGQGGINYTANGYLAMLGHEARRVAVFYGLDTYLVNPAEKSGSEVTKCGWICRDSYEDAQLELDMYVLNMQNSIIDSYELFRDIDMDKITDEDLVSNIDVKNGNRWNGYKKVAKLLDYENLAKAVFTSFHCPPAQ